MSCLGRRAIVRLPDFLCRTSSVCWWSLLCGLSVIPWLLIGCNLWGFDKNRLGKAFIHRHVFLQALMAELDVDTPGAAPYPSECVAYRVLRSHLAVAVTLIRTSLRHLRRVLNKGSRARKVLLLRWVVPEGTHWLCRSLVVLVSHLVQIVAYVLYPTEKLLGGARYVAPVRVNRLVALGRRDSLRFHDQLLGDLVYVVLQ